MDFPHVYECRQIEANVANEVVALYSPLLLGQPVKKGREGKEGKKCFFDEANVASENVAL